MKIDNAMHTVRDKASEGHFIAMDGRINGRESPLVFDTGAGVNIISSRQAGIRKRLASSGCSHTDGWDRYAAWTSCNGGYTAYW